MSIYVTSDIHFGHNKEFLYGPRGFQNIEDHDNAIIENWNSMVGRTDEVYVLGDLVLCDTAAGIEKMCQLNGNLHIIRGNHDSAWRVEEYKTLHNVCEVVDAKYLRYGKYHFYLSHYAALTSNWDYDKPLAMRLISLCGHTHTKDRYLDWDKGLIYHCELDAHNMFPKNIEEILSEVKTHSLIINL